MANRAPWDLGHVSWRQRDGRRACPRAAAVETKVRPDESREPRTAQDGGEKGWRGRGSLKRKGPPSYWARGDTTQARRMDIWDEGRELADPPLILFLRGVSPPQFPSSWDLIDKVVRVHEAGAGEEP